MQAKIRSNSAQLANAWKYKLDIDAWGNKIAKTRSEAQYTRNEAGEIVFPRGIGKATTSRWEFVPR